MGIAKSDEAFKTKKTLKSDEKRARIGDGLTNSANKIQLGLEAETYQ